MKLIVAVGENYVRIEDRDTSSSPDVLDDWCTRAGRLLATALTAAHAASGDEDA